MAANENLANAAMAHASRSPKKCKYCNNYYYHYKLKQHQQRCEQYSKYISEDNRYRLRVFTM